MVLGIVLIHYLNNSNYHFILVFMAFNFTAIFFYPLSYKTEPLPRHIKCESGCLGAFQVWANQLSRCLCTAISIYLSHLSFCLVLTIPLCCRCVGSLQVEANVERKDLGQASLHLLCFPSTGDQPCVKNDNYPL